MKSIKSSFSNKTHLRDFFFIICDSLLPSRGMVIIKKLIKWKSQPGTVFKTITQKYS